MVIHSTPPWVFKEKSRKALAKAKKALLANDSQVTTSEEIRLSVSIMHAPWVDERKVNVGELKKLIPEATVVEDCDREGIWTIAKRGWRTHSAGATHHLLLQDDAILCNNFIEGVKRAIASRPNSPISLFARHSEIEKATARGENWATMYHPTGLALILPVNLIEEFISWADINFAASYQHDDERFHCWAIHVGNPTRFTVPSLVEHQHFKSTAGNPSTERRAKSFIGNRSPLDIKW